MANLSHKISQRMVDGGGAATTMGLSGGTPTKLMRGAEALPARLVANAGAVSLWGDGGVVAVVEKRDGSS